MNDSAFLMYGRSAIERAQTYDEISRFLCELRERYQTANIIYNTSRSIPFPGGSPLMLGTCDLFWIRQYNEERLVEIDPIVLAARYSMLPVEWKDVDQTGRANRYFFSQLRRFNVGRYGVTIPLEGHGGERGFLAMSHDGNEDEWYTCYHQHIAEFTYLGRYIHDRMLAIRGGGQRQWAPRLSRKSAICLELLAHGSDPAEIAHMLGLSIHTVRKHLDRAVTALDCKTKMEAVLKAARLGFLPNAAYFLSTILASSTMLDDLFIDHMIMWI
ncbi:DNA-binding CsgD family transcriptional regulator [Rhizobium sp. ERR 922]|uniref:helix-turn-helix transcriptional regulator n=1 Tax=unclassified Rhizobium TaxID=2613769 RepID=UPI0011A56194|nr:MULTISPECIES: LuxR family transcriptional regulator [unclassified Rhizobium]TWB46388.1 DNA-binding CsgD family transcriptional regulator [Rhizobium sp. ERR 922]TWB88755.1 DNA-binding CsgD family transcriptional regulator [Rhizobium sp. ERR 942]